LILLNFKETKKWGGGGEKNFCNKWLDINEGLAIERMKNCTKMADLKILEYTCINLDLNGRAKLEIYN
jgi:hypothetical protein